VIEAATVVLLLALPFLLWPLLRPAPEPVEREAAEVAREELAHQLEEVELDLASGRLDRSEADRRLAELRSDAG
jgi:cytochrome c-type biogenesis protein CcmI